MDFLGFFFHSLEQRITISVKEVGDLLSQIKGGGQVSQKNAVTIEADDSLRPLMDLLDGKYSFTHPSRKQLFIFSILFLFFFCQHAKRFFL